MRNESTSNARTINDSSDTSSNARRMAGLAALDRNGVDLGTALRGVALAWEDGSEDTQDSERESEPNAQDLAEIEMELSSLPEFSEDDSDSEGRGWDVFAAFNLTSKEEQRAARRDKQRNERAARRISRALEWMES